MVTYYCEHCHAMTNTNDTCQHCGAKNFHQIEIQVLNQSDSYKEIYHDN